MSRILSGVCEASRIDLRATGTESHSSLNVGETLHETLRRIFRTVIKDDPDCTSEYALSISVKALNDTADNDGLCPTLLVFGIIPPFPDAPTIYPNQQDRKRAMCTARMEFERILAEKRVNIGPKSTVPSAANHVFSAGEMVHVHRENMKRWIGPLKLIHTYGKHALVLLKDTPREFNVAQQMPAPILGRAIDPVTDARTVYITEVLSPNDPRKSLFWSAIAQEMNGLVDRGTFQLSLRSEGGPNASVLPSRFVLSIKRADDGEEIYKARLVVGGHRDKSKSSLVHI
jgi:hypothetical protein